LFQIVHSLLFISHDFKNDQLEEKVSEGVVKLQVKSAVVVPQVKVETEAQTSGTLK
jgi:hypothetical protein